MDSHSRESKTFTRNIAMSELSEIDPFKTLPLTMRLEERQAAVDPLKYEAGIEMMRSLTLKATNRGLVVRNWIDHQVCEIVWVFDYPRKKTPSRSDG